MDHARPTSLPPLGGRAARAVASAVVVAVLLSLLVVPVVPTGAWATEGNAEAEGGSEAEDSPEEEDSPESEGDAEGEDTPEVEDDPGVDGPLPAPPTDTTVASRGIDRVCPAPEDVAVEAAATFDDAGSTHGAAIACAVAYGLVGGFGDGTYRPSEPVTRGQTASVVATWLELATGFPLEVPDEPPFDDLGRTHGDAVAALADIAVLGGRSDGTFAPDEPLTRGQFTGVVARAISYADVFSVSGPLPPAPVGDTVVFDDVAGSTFEADILALAGARITTGTGEGVFSPQRPVTRGQLATFLLRAADYLDRHQRWKPTATTQLLLAELTVPDTAWPPPDAEGLDILDDEGRPDDDPDAEVVPPRALVTLLINAFDGSLGYLLDLSQVPRDPGDDARVVLRLPGSGGEGVVVLVLVGPEQLAQLGSGERFASGSAVEADSLVRFADLLHRNEDARVELESSAVPGGVLRGALRRP